MKAKPLLVLAFFLMFIALFASSAIGGTDLTPDTPPAPTAVRFDAGLSGAAGVLPGARFAAAGQPCGAVYTVRSGDTLSRIAAQCGVTLAELLAANPAITDPNLIRVDQLIAMPAGSPVSAPVNAGVASPTLAAPVLAAPVLASPVIAEPVIVPTSQPAPALLVDQPGATPDAADLMATNMAPLP